MKNVLLLHPPLLFYKVRIYNSLHRELAKRGYTLYVWATHIQEGSDPALFQYINRPMTAKNLIAITRQYKISIFINIMSKTTTTLLFYCFSILYAKITNINNIYYGHGLDLSMRNNFLKKWLQNAFHLAFDRILLYSEEQCKYLWRMHAKKIFIAQNTLILNGYTRFDGTSIKDIKNKYGICEDSLVLFSGRISKRKNFHLLLEIFQSDFAGSAEVGFVVVGPGLPERYESVIGKYNNFHYLGPVYDVEKMNEIFHMSDLFCVPGSLGLGIVEAMYWGLPVLTLDALHGPEAMYLRNGHNGFILKNIDEIAKMISYLFENRKLLNFLGENARATIESEAGIEKMFGGFYQVLASLQ